jgi:hypothetical protein
VRDRDRAVDFWKAHRVGRGSPSTQKICPIFVRAIHYFD